MKGNESEERSREGGLSAAADSATDRLIRFLERRVPSLVEPALLLSFRLFEREAERMHAAFDRTGRIDIEPLSGDGRGFRLITDRRTAFYFRQDGDGFEYDGYEVGEYGKGDVTLFDDIPGAGG